MAQPDNTSKTLRIKNWARFQHFKERRPVWVKLYCDLLDNIEWHDLDPAAAKALVMLWLIAAEDHGVLPPIRELAFRLRMPENSIKSIISRLSDWLEQDDIDLISCGYQDDALEKRTSNKKKEEGEVGQNNGTGAIAPSPLSERELAFENYNTMAEHLGLAKAVSLTKTRKAQLDARLRDVGLPGWNAALENLADMPFCFGENARGWKVSLDWLLSPTNLNKILEKQYAREEKSA